MSLHFPFQNLGGPPTADFMALDSLRPIYEDFIKRRRTMPHPVTGLAAFGRSVFGSHPSGGLLGAIRGTPQVAAPALVPVPAVQTRGRGTMAGRGDVVMAGLGTGGLGQFAVGLAAETVTRSIWDRGEIDLPGDDELTTAQIRSFLLREAGKEIGKKRISYREFRSLVRDLGVVRAQDVLNLDETSMMFLLTSAPKRRGRGISAAQIRNVRKTARKFKSMQSALSDICPPGRRYRRKK